MLRPIAGPNRARSRSESRQPPQRNRIFATKAPLLFFLVCVGAAAFASTAAAEPVPDGEAPAGHREGLAPRDDSGGIDAEQPIAEDADSEAVDAAPRARKRKTQVEEIVVTARKREELLGDTPVAVTALSAENLRDSGAYRLDQMTELVPNLHFQVTSQQGNFAQFSIRGIGSGSPDIQFDPGVAIYLDGVYLPRAAGSLLNVADVQQIEVLRGPQGTLFGKNSVGGAINVTTVKPQPDLAAYAMVRPGNFDSLDTQAMLNVPIIDDLLLSRVSFFRTQRDGYVHDSFTDANYNDQDDMVFLGSLRTNAFASDDLTFDLSGMWSRSQSNGIAGRCVVVREDGPVAGLFPDLFDACRETSTFTTTSDVNGLSEIESAGTWGVLNYDLGDWWVFENLAIKGLGSWNHQTTKLRFDVDGTSEDIVYLSSAGGSAKDRGPSPAEQTSGELQVNGEALEGRVVFVGGLFAQWETATDERTTNVVPPLDVLSTTNIADIKNWTWAPYTQVTVNPIEWLSLTGGVRYTQDHKQLTLTQIQPNSGAVLFPTTTDAKLFTRWTPMASIASTLPDNLLPSWADHFMGYFTYSQGFKGGGFNALPGAQAAADTPALAAPFDQETLNNYEVGFKTVWLDNRLTLNAAFFLGKYDDIQKVSIVTMGTGENIVVQRITENAARATIKGLEIESLLYLFDGLQITGNIGITDTEYDSFPNAISDYSDEEIDRSGESFNNVPKFTSFLAAQYTWPLAIGDSLLADGSLTPRLEWYYQTKVHLLGPELNASKQPGYNLMNARLAYSFMDDRAQIALWGKNLTDEEFIVFSQPTVSSFGVVVNAPGLPRTFGGEVSYRF